MATTKKEVKTQVFSLVRDLTDSDKCPPQARAIVSILKAHGKAISRKDLLEAMKVTGVITTTQSIERIFGFYRPRLVDMGVMKEDVHISHVEVEVPDKPAKEPKAPKAEKAAAGDGKTAEGKVGEKAPKVDAAKDHKGTAKTA